MKRHNKIPKTLHEALRLAIDDVILFKDRKDVEFYMPCWYFKDLETNVCHVCLAGAVMLATKEERGYSVDSMNRRIFKSKKWHKTLTSLNLLRMGHLYHAISEMYDNDEEFAEDLVAKFREQGDFKLLDFDDKITKGDHLDGFILYLESLYERLKQAGI